MNKRNFSWVELNKILMFAADKFKYIGNRDKWVESASEFVRAYIHGGRFVVYNSRNQFLADFDTLDDAIYYKEENEPKNELFSIECEILN